ncbi:hypothetical protein BOTCAL_0299g00080 [Botryotinia calthae]|uniref:Uncharacterized protein n=1 Tax=Botryotinia calthae TaxID=38488 RepID=A0A4Y8CUJ3_9HELO|nr:hypothetical protein BOTCAL_0299g00080 [Botryotinia calthae]
MGNQERQTTPLRTGRKKGTDIKNKRRLIAAAQYLAPKFSYSNYIKKNIEVFAVTEKEYVNDLAHCLLKSAFLPNNSFNLDDPEVKALHFTEAALDIATSINRQLASRFYIIS